MSHLVFISVLNECVWLDPAGFWNEFLGTSESTFPKVPCLCFSIQIHVVYFGFKNSNVQIKMSKIHTKWGHARRLVSSLHPELELSQVSQSQVCPWSQHMSLLWGGECQTQLSSRAVQMWASLFSLLKCVPMSIWDVSAWIHSEGFRGRFNRLKLHPSLLGISAVFPMLVMEGPGCYVLPFPTFPGQLN